MWNVYIKLKLTSLLINDDKHPQKIKTKNKTALFLFNKSSKVGTLLRLKI